MFLITFSSSESGLLGNSEYKRTILDRAGMGTAAECMVELAVSQRHTIAIGTGVNGTDIAPSCWAMIMTYHRTMTLDTLFHHLDLFIFL